MSETTIEETRRALERATALANTREAELNALREEMTSKAEAFHATVEILRTEKAQLENTLAELRAERDRLASEAAALRAKAEQSNAEERAENELLRERIGGIAADVARLAMNLEGPHSPIRQMLDDDAAQSGDHPDEAAHSAGESRLSLLQRIRNAQSRARS